LNYGLEILIKNGQSSQDCR